MGYRPLVQSLTLTGSLLLAIIPTRAADTSLRAQAQGLFAPLPPAVSTAENPLTPEKVGLGRRLYFEPRVSVDGTVSCARCHQPALYGTDALPRSIGAEHRVHPRHAQTVLNAATQFVQHWRGDRTRSGSLPGAHRAAGPRQP